MWVLFVMFTAGMPGSALPLVRFRAVAPCWREWSMQPIQGQYARSLQASCLKSSSIGPIIANSLQTCMSALPPSDGSAVQLPSPA